MSHPWQVHFYLVPHRAMRAAPRTLTPAIVSGTDWWANSSMPADYRTRAEGIVPLENPSNPDSTRLAGIAPLEKPSNPDHEVWGSADGNAIEVTSNHGRVVRVDAYVDVRRLDPTFGARLLAFVKYAQCVLVRSDGWVAEATVSDYSTALRNSAAWRFVNEAPGADVLPDGD